jgi:RimJ/RimL family protein N-acetyltransferase
MTDVIETRRLILRTAQTADIDSIRHYARDPEIARWTLLPRPYRRADAINFINLSKRSTRKKKPREILLAIEYKATDGTIGAIGLHQINYLHRNAEIGCWLGRPFRGRGLMQEAMQALLKHAFTTLKLKRVSAQVFVGNVASMRMVRRCGFTREGCLRANLLQRNRWRTSYIYSILREEFQVDDNRGTRRR